MTLDMEPIESVLNYAIKSWDFGNGEREIFEQARDEIIRLRALVEELVAALEWVAGHAYAGGKSFRDTPIVLAALAKAKQEMTTP